MCVAVNVGFGFVDVDVVAVSNCILRFCIVIFSTCDSACCEDGCIDDWKKYCDCYLRMRLVVSKGLNSQNQTEMRCNNVTLP